MLDKPPLVVVVDDDVGVDEGYVDDAADVRVEVEEAISFLTLVEESMRGALLLVAGQECGERGSSDPRDALTCV